MARRTVLSRLASAGLVGIASATAPGILRAAPYKRELLWNTLELNLGPPGKFIPQSVVLDRQVAAEPQYAAQMERWRTMVARTRTLERGQQLQYVQSMLQSIPYRDDFALTGARDHWAHPLEFMSKGGDCEDYAIAKFKALEAAGIPATDLRIVIGRTAGASGFHAVLVAFVAGQAMVLDNKATTVYRQAQQTAFDPICSLDRNNLWLHWNGSDLDKRIALLRTRLNRQFA